MTDFKTRSESFFENAGNRIPAITKNMVDSVSQYRKASLAKEVESGLFREGSSVSGGENRNKLTSASNLTSLSTGFRKNSQSLGSGSGSGGNYRGGFGDSVKQAPEIYSPLWLSSNLSLPRDRATINAWCRSYYATNPFVQNAISLHSTYPISKLSIKCPNKKIEQFFNDMIEETDLMNVCVQIAQEYWLLGEAFINASLNESTGKWDSIVLQNPDFMVVKRTALSNEPDIFMRPDENLKKIIMSTRPSDVEQRKQLNQYIIDCVKRGNDIPMDSLTTSFISRKISPYDTRGSGLPVTIFKQLMLFDRLRESKYAQADRMINPLTLVKIGSADFKPTFADLEQWRAIFESAQSDKDFKVFTHEGVSVEPVGFGGGIYDIGPDIEKLIKEIYIGLQVPSTLLDGGDSTTYANAGVALDVLRQRYMTFRNKISHWLKTKIFAPISKLQGFYDYHDDMKELIIPEIDWNHMSLFDTDSYINNMITLSAGEGEQKRASVHSLHKSLGLDTVDENRKMRKEAIEAAIQKKEREALDKMDLNTLRALGDDDEIQEPEEGSDTPVPGETTGGGEMPDLGSPGGMDLGSGLDLGGGDVGGGLDLGGMADTPPPPPAAPEPPPSE